jgi:CheY-like chemotaxis protein
MNSHGADQSYFALVDDDSHSAQLLIRMLLAHGAPSVSWMEGEAIADAELGKVLGDRRAVLPGLVIVDLKSSATATAGFIGKLRAMRDGPALLIAAMAPTLDRKVREALLEAGADAVFQRQSDIDFYRREAAAIISFWVRNQRLKAVGT